MRALKFARIRWRHTTFVLLLFAHDICVCVCANIQQNLFVDDPQRENSSDFISSSCSCMFARFFDSSSWSCLLPIINLLLLSPGGNFYLIDFCRRRRRSNSCNSTLTFRVASRVANNYVKRAHFKVTTRNELATQRNATLAHSDDKFSSSVVKRRRSRRR